MPTIFLNTSGAPLGEKLINLLMEGAIEKNNHVAGNITVSGKEEKDLGIQFEGLAQKILEKRHDLAVAYFKKRRKGIPKEDEDFLKGHFWYQLKPRRIELICEEFFGFKKQKLIL